MTLAFTRKLSAAVAGVGCAAALTFGAPVASAHDAVVGGSVTEGEVLEQFPEKITLEFSGVPREGFNTFAVTNKDDGQVLFSQAPTIEGRNLSIEVPKDKELGDGNYQVGFQITSSDGHATRGGVSFSVAGSGASSTSGSTDGSTPPSDRADANSAASESSSANSGDASGLGGPLKWVIAVGAVLAAAAVVLVLIGKRR